jgi:NAD(P)-dependent dehydrogenase (short-subunit alcohol dehydrogenase family)
MSNTKTVLITGASSGIGLATSRQLAAGGAHVVMVSRDPARGATARDEVASVATGPEPNFLTTDLSSQASIRALAVVLHDRVGSIDVLINNAGIASGRRELSVDGLFTYELARRLEGTAVTANCFTPGPTASDFGRGMGGVIGIMGGLMRLIGRPAEESARTAVYLATSPEMEGLTGQYFFHGKPARSKPITYDASVAAQLWSVSESLTGAGEQLAMEAIR